MRTASGAFRRVARTRVSRLASVAAVAALLLAGRAPSAQAGQDGGLTLTVAQRWNQLGNPGTWSPYSVTVRNDGAAGFDGEVVLTANPPRSSQYPADAFPPYHAAVNVPAGSQRTMVVTVTEAPGGYHAELRDAGGRVVAAADPAGTARTDASVAVLSDVVGADRRIEAPLHTLTRVNVALSRFGSAHEFPTRAVELSGLNGVVLDQFATGVLDQAQVRALEDFVGLGGVLVETGGASWRRTLQPLPAALLPLRPTDTGSAPVTALADLGAVTTDAAAQVATGDLAGWASAPVRTADGTPLIAEGPYGAGRIVELAFDPLAAPFDTRPDLAALSWSQALARGLSGVQGGVPLSGARPVFGPGAQQQVSLAGSGPGAWGPGSTYLSQVLGDMPEPPLPPFGLLALLLIAYGLLASAGSYALLRSVGRSGLLWVAVPALALVFTGVAYVVGFGPRGSDFQVTEAQVLRAGPGGVVETSSLDGVLAPRRGDVGVSARTGSAISTAATPYSSSAPGARDTVVVVGPRPAVRFSNVAVWDMRTVQTLQVDHPFGAQPDGVMPVEAHLRLQRGRVQGQVVNHTGRTVRDLVVTTPYGTPAALAAALAPGATASVDVPLPPVPVVYTGKAVAVPGAAPGPVGPLPQGPQNARQALVTMAAGEAAGRPGELALVGFTDPVDRLRVDGGRAGGSVRAVLVEPVRPEQADALAAAPPVPRLVSSLSTGGPGAVDVFEFDVPSGLAGRVAVAPQGTAPGSSIDVYDWARHAWRPLAAGGLGPDQTGPGVVRVRVRNGVAGQVPVGLSDVA
jgi:hypothetical protein